MKRKSIAALFLIVALFCVLAFCVLTKEDRQDPDPGISVTWPTNSSLAHSSTVHLYPETERIRYTQGGVFEAVFTNTIGLPITLRNASVRDNEGSVQCESSMKTANGGMTVPPGGVFTLSAICGQKEPGQIYSNTITLFYDILPSPSGMMEEGFIGGRVAKNT
jgi:hypothetical protein